MASLKEILAAKKSAAAVVTAPEVAAPAEPPKDHKLNTDQSRQLGEKEGGGPQVPFDFLSEKRSEEAKLWLQCRQLSQSNLGIAIEPEGQHAWIALDHPSDPGRPLLLFRLPLLNQKNGDSIPF